MKVLFVHTFDYYEPLGIMSLSSYLKENGHECELLDVKFHKRYIEEAKRINPDIIAYSITTNNWKKYHSINLELKKNLTFFSIFGGPHCTFFPEFINEPGVDGICRGEGEEAMLELANALQKNSSILSIKNLYIKAPSGIIQNELRPLIQDLDSLPFPDRDLINKYKHYQKRSRARTITSRGCPYRCSYCFNHSNQKLYSGKGKYVRHRSPGNVVHEIKNLKEIYHLNNVEFHDDVFILDKDWLSEFSKIYVEEKVNLPFEINVRVELVNPEIVELLKKAGCYSVQFGIESGNEEIRKKLLHRTVSDQEMIKNGKLLNEAGIKTNTYNMIGFPNETIDNVFETIDLNVKCSPSYAMNTIYHPYPMNDLTEISINSGLFNGNYDEYKKNLFYENFVVKIPERRKFIRLHYLFAFCVKFPQLKGLCKILMHLPLGWIYRLIYFCYRVYVIFFVFKRLTIREIFIKEKIYNG